MKNNSSKLGVMFIGIYGSVATTVIAGVNSAVRGICPLQGVLTEEAHLQPHRFLPIENFIFSGWDIRETNLLDAMIDNNVIPKSKLENMEEYFSSIHVWNGTVKGAGNQIRQMAKAGLDHNSLTLREITEILIGNIHEFKNRNNLDKIIVVNTASVDRLPDIQIRSIGLTDFEKMLDTKTTKITPAILYAYAAIKSNCPYINFTPDISAEIPALETLANDMGVPYTGKDGKTGQTLYKSYIASMLKTRQLRVEGWYSTNLLGNRDGIVLEDPEHKELKLTTKSDLIPSILGYDDFVHIVKIEYYPPRGDNKEAWDNIDFIGWMGEKMSMKIIWEGKDSILAAPIIVDLLRLVEYAHRLSYSGSLSHLSMFFKAPYGDSPHDPLEQCVKLHNFFQKHE
jgi:myo-inositol-1-phosphate synthase